MILSSWTMGLKWRATGAWRLCAIGYGVVIATSTLAAQAAPRWVAVEDLRIDANAEKFSAFSRIHVDARGRFAIPQPQDRQVLVYDAAGRRTATIGRNGAGPGEFRAVGAINWFGDTLLVLDQALRRASYFDGRGKLLATRAFPSPMAATPVRGMSAPGTSRFFIPFAGTPDGGLSGIAHVRKADPRLRDQTESRVVLTVSPGGVATVLATPPQDNDERWVVTINGLEKRIPFAFQPQYLSSVDGQRFAFLSADQGRANPRYTVAAFGIRPETLFIRDYGYAGIEIPARAADSAISAMAAPGVRESGEAPPTRFQDEARSRLPAFYSPVDGMVLGLDGTVWVMTRPTGTTRGVVALDQKGNVLGTVLLPRSARLQQASLSFLWATDVDADGLASAVRYRLVGR